MLNQNEIPLSWNSQPGSYSLNGLLSGVLNHGVGDCPVWQLELFSKIATSKDYMSNHLFNPEKDLVLPFILELDIQLTSLESLLI